MKKPLRLLCTVVLCLSVCLSGCGKAGHTCRSELFAFSADCPDGWSYTEDEYSACFYAPDEENDDFYESVIYAGAVNYNAENGVNTLDGYADILCMSLSAQLSDFTVLSRESGKIAGMDALVLTYRCTSSQTAYTMVQRRYIMQDKKSFYQLIYTATEGTFEKFEPAAASIAGSFRIK